MDKNSIAFDQFQRYETVSRMINCYRGKEERRFRILEVGANEHKDLILFLPMDDIVFSDMILTETMRMDSDFIQVDGTEIPFANDTFDFVVGVDVLEHIPLPKRGLFLSEIYRVSKVAALISFPYNSSEVIQAETRVNEYFKVLSGSDFLWLKEHLENELPSVEDIEKILQSLNINSISFYHGSLYLWEKLWYCHFRTVFSQETLNYRKEIDRFYNSRIYSGDTQNPCYRVFYVLSAQSFWENIDENILQKMNYDSMDLNILNVLLTMHVQVGDMAAQINQTKQFDILKAIINQNGHSIEEILNLNRQSSGLIQEQSQLQQRLLQNDLDLKKKEQILQNHVRDIELLRMEKNVLTIEYQHMQAEYDGILYHEKEIIKKMEETEFKYNEILNSHIWKITKPIRFILNKFRKTI